MTCEWIPIEGTVEEILDVNARPFGSMLSSESVIVKQKARLPSLAIRAGTATAPNCGPPRTTPKRRPNTPAY